MSFKTAYQSIYLWAEEEEPVAGKNLKINEKKKQVCEATRRFVFMGTPHLA